MVIDFFFSNLSNVSCLKDIDVINPNQVQQLASYSLLPNAQPIMIIFHYFFSLWW